MHVPYLCTGGEGVKSDVYNCIVSLSLQGEVRSSSVFAEPVDVHRVPGVSDSLRACTAPGIPGQEGLSGVSQRHR